MRKVVRFPPISEIGAGEKLHQCIQGDDPTLFLLLKTLPIAKMFFRPEEAHRTSGVGYTENPSSDRDRDMPDQPFGILVLNPAILHLDSDGLAAIKANRIDLYCLSRKKPADRQRLERSLAEPLLFPVNGQTVMRWEIVERGKGHDAVGLGV